jgi:hypothetical protein
MIRDGAPLPREIRRRTRLFRDVLVGGRVTEAAGWLFIML